MKKHVTVRFRCDIDLKKWLSSLKKSYNINNSEFIREAIIDKMKKDVPKLRLKKESDKIKVPF